MAVADRRLAQTTGQLGAFSRTEAGRNGLTARQLRSRVQSGFLVKAGVNVYRFPGGLVTAHDQLRSLLLDVGDEAWASGPTAAALLRFDGFTLAPPFHVTIRRGRDVQRVGHRIHTTKIMPPFDLIELEGVIATRAARTIIDLARDEPVDRLTTAVESALRDRWITEESLHRRVAALTTPGRFGIPKLLAVLAERDRRLGAHSWLERRFLQIVEQAGLPRPDCQVVHARVDDRPVRVDFSFPGTSVIVEVLGYQFHRSRQQLQRDTERMNALILAGKRPIQFTYSDLTGSPRPIITALQQASVSAHTT